MRLLGHELGYVIPHTVNASPGVHCAGGGTAEGGLVVSLGFVAILRDARAAEECRSPSDGGHGAEKSGFVSQWPHVRWRMKLD